METADTNLFAASDAGTRAWASMTVVSLLCHIVFLAVVHYLPEWRPKRKTTLPPVVNVTMVSLPEAAAPDPAPAAEAKAPRPVVQPAPKKQAPSPEPEKKVPERPPEPIVKRSMKKKTFQSSKVVESVISRLEEKVAEEAPDPLQQALERLRQQVGESEQAARSKESRPASPPEAGAGLVGGSTEGIRKELELIDIYRMEIAWRVQKNWAFADPLARSKQNLVVELAFNVLPNGEIRDVWYDKRSGNRHLDESAKRAVLKANPVGPFPEGIAKPMITVGLRFTPEGVK